MKKIGIDKSTAIRHNSISTCALVLSFTCVLVLLLSGCGKQMARMEKQQIEMQSILKANSEQLAAITQQLEQNKLDLQENIKQLQNSNIKLTENIVALQQQQNNLVETQLKTNQTVSEKIDALHISHAADIGGLQSEVKQVQNSNAKLSENVTALQQQQVSLVETQQNTSQAVSKKIDTLQISHAADIGGLQSEVKQVQNSNTKLTENVTALQQQQASLVETQQNTSQAIGEKIDALQISHAADIGGLQSDLKQVQSSNAKLTENVTALQKQQASLVETQQNTSQTISVKITAIENSTQQLQTGLKTLQTLSSDTAGKVTSLNNEQIKLQQAMQTSNVQLAEKILSIEKKLTDWYSTSQTIANDIKQVTTEVNTLGQDLSKLHGTFQKEFTALHNESAALAKSIDETGKKHLEFQQKFQTELKSLSESIGLIKQSQAELEKQIEPVKTVDTTTTSYSPAIIEQPKEADSDRKEISFQ